MNERTFSIGPLEMQIAYKFWLGSEKDIVDAIYIREISRDFINEDLLRDFCSSFGVNLIPPDPELRKQNRRERIWVVKKIG